jgi:hypothetical protein
MSGLQADFRPDQQDLRIAAQIRSHKRAPARVQNKVTHD